MPLVELKMYKPVCDRCGKVGSTWTNLPEREQEKAVPEGWKWVRPEDLRIPLTLDLVCEGCFESFKDIGSRPPGAAE